MSLFEIIRHYSLFLLTTTLSGYLFYKVVCCFTQPRNSIILKILIVLSLSIVGNTVIMNEDPINVTYAMVGFFLVMLLGFRGSLWPRLSVVMVLYPIMTAWNFIYFDIGMRLSSSMTDFFLDFWYRLLVSLLLLLFWFIIYRLAKSRLPGVIGYLDGRSWFFVDIISLSPFISVIIAVIITPVGREWGAYLIGLTSIVTSLGVFFLLSIFASRIRSEAEVSNLTLRAGYYRELESNQEEIRRMRHDMRNHLGVVGGLLEAGETLEARQYLDELTATTAATTRTYCANSVVNAVINAKFNLGREQGIDCSFAVDIGNILSIEALDLCTIFANTLDNAIEAAAAAPEPRLEMKARCSQGYFSYRLSNTISQPITEAVGKFLTAKRDKKNHGLGLTTVQNIVEKYSGTMEITYTATEFNVVIIIAL